MPSPECTQVIYDRPTWGRHLEFIMTCVSHTVGLGNIWRFPHLCFKNGGGAFLIPYFISLALMGLPLFFLEIAFGQFAGLGTISCWEINPIYKGFGISMTVLSEIVSIYYSVIIALCFYYFFASMQSNLPWKYCGNEWNTCYCREAHMDRRLNPLIWHSKTGLNCTGHNITMAMTKNPSEEYYYHKVLDITNHIGESGGIKWDITLCNFLCWCVVFTALIGGVKTLGKIAYISALLPYFLMTILLLKGFTLPGSMKGIDYYMLFDLQKIGSPDVWADAASQILFSLSCCLGTLIAMSSYNKFHANCMRDSVVISFANCSTSVYAGFTVFSIVGYLASSTGRDIKDVITSGPGLVFIAYPAALGQMPLSQLWSIFFFLMMILLGMGSQLVMVESVITALEDECRFLRKRDIYFRIFVCFFGFLMGLPQTTYGGFHVLTLVDHFIRFPFLLIGLSETIIIIWAYSPKKFAEDMMMMLGYSNVNKMVFHFYFLPILMFSTPVFVAGILVSTFYNYKRYKGPDWAETLGWLLVAFIMMWACLWFIAGRVFWRDSTREMTSSFGKVMFQPKESVKKERPSVGQDYTAAGSDGIRNSIHNLTSQRPSVRWVGHDEEHDAVDSIHLDMNIPEHKTSTML